MHSRRPKSSELFAPLYLILSGKAAFYLKNALTVLKQNSVAGIVAGVFFAMTVASYGVFHINDVAASLKS